MEPGATTRREVFWLRASLAAPLLLMLPAAAVGWWQLLVRIGLPYSMFSALLLGVLWQRPAAAYYSTAKLAPVLFVPVQVAALAVPDMLAGGSPAILLKACVPVLLVVLPIGYAFVAALFALRWLAYRRRP